MKFWGVEVPRMSKVKVEVKYFKAHHITLVALGEGKNGASGNNVIVNVRNNYNEERYVVATLSSETKPQAILDLVFEADFVLSHDWNKGSVFISGYIEEAPFNFKAVGIKSMPGGHSFHMLAHSSNKKKENSDLTRCVREWRKTEKKRKTLCLVVKNLRTSTKRETLKNYFAEYGTVEEVSLLNYQDNTFARSALVKMKSLDSVRRIKEKRHYINHRFMQIEKYWGDDALKQSLTYGRYKLILKRLKKSGPQLNEDESRKVGSDLLESLEDAFTELPFTSVLLRKDEKERYTGDAEVGFKEKSKVLDRVKRNLRCKAVWEDAVA